MLLAMNCNARRGGAIVVILVVMLGLGVLAVLGVVAAGLFVARNVRVTERAEKGETRVETPFGSVRVRQGGRLDPKHLGVPLYPGAERRDHEGKLASVELELGDTHREFAVMAGEYTTDDSVERVMEFYRRELAHWTVSRRDRGGFQIMLSERGHKRIVAVHEKNGRTHIALASVGEPASN
jgi:hypothetical protein